MNGGAGGQGGGSGYVGGGGGGGGAGGGILIHGSSITISGIMRTNGTAGGAGGGGYGDSCGGGGSPGNTGGSGRIKLFYAGLTNTGTITATGYGTSYSGCNSGTIYCGSSGYVASGTFTSQIKDTNQVNSSWGNISWTTTQPSSATQIILKARTSNSATMSGAPAFSTCNALATINTTNGNATGSAAMAGNNCVTAGDRYVQYEAAFSTSNTAVTPTFSDVTVNYNYYPTSQTLTSSAYNTQNSGNVLSKITWTENLPANTDVKFQIRTAPDSSGAPGTYTAWCGPDDATSGNCSSATYFTDPAGSETIDDILRDGYNNQWIQYKVWLTTSDGLNTPTLSALSLEYNINTAPVVSVTSAVQNPDGTISVGYNISDAEQTSATVSLFADIGVTLNETLGASTDPGAGAVTVSSATLLPTSGAIQIENEEITYTGKSGNDLTGAVRAANSSKYASHSSGVAVWIKGTTASGSTGNVTGLTSSPASKTASWTIATDLPGVSTSTAKIRVSANDGQVGNPVGTGDSSAFTLDTLAPSSLSFKIDSTAASITLTNISVTDTASYQVRYANASNIDGSTCSADIASSSYESLVGSAKDWTLSPDSNGVSTVCFQAKDSYSNQSAVTFVATPWKPLNTRINDISVPPASKYKLLVWWDTVPDPGSFSKYNVYRCDRAEADAITKCDSISNFSLLNTITNRTINYCIDEGDGDCADNSNGLLTNTTTYYYKITAEDIDGISPYSTAASGLPTYPNVAGTPNGSTVGEVDTTDPVISFTEAIQGPSTGNGNLSDTTASLTYSATDANGVVFLSVAYEASATSPASYTKEAANPSMITSGQNGTVSLAGLASNTKYYYKVKARDNSGNTAELGPYFFTTTSDSTAPAAISDLAAPAADVKATSFVLSWTATGDDDNIGTASSYDIRYSTVSASDIDTNWASATQIANEPLPQPNGTSQSMVITGLAPSTTYYFAIKTKDEIPNTSAISNVLAVTTPAQADLDIPDITAVSAGTPGAASVTITWTTANKTSSSLIDFGATTSYGTTQGNSSELVNSHSVTLVGLAPSTAYKFRAKSVSGSGNTGTDDNGGLGYSFTTASAAVGALPVITSVASSSVTATSALVTWTTSGVSSDSTVGYSVDPDKTYTMETGSSSAVESHSVTLTGLAPSTKYYYRVKSRNNDQLATASSDANGDFSFTTLAGADTIPPIISSVQVDSVTSNKATITWTTSENADSYVDFGTASGVYTSTQGLANDSTVSHSVTLTSLTPETTYYFRVRSSDAAGNQATSVGSPFATTSGAAVDCPTRAGASCQACETCPSSDITAPVISGVKVENISFNSAVVTWITDEEASSVVNYDTVSYGIKQSYGHSAGKVKDSSKLHSVILSNLDSATTYYFQAYSADARGNVAESDTQSFKTIAVIEAKDKGEAVAADLKKEFEDIAQILVKDNLATEENIREIISRISNPPIIGSEGPVVRDIKSYGATVVWKTDRKSNAVVKFKPENTDKVLSAGTNWKQIGVMDAYGIEHAIELIGLAPSTAYSFYVQSQDILGGVAKSETQSFTTSSLSSIFNVAVADLNLTQATISWETSNLSTSSLEWGLSPSYGNYKDKGSEKVQKHSVTLDNLSSGTTYHYRARSVEETGAILSSDDYSFATPDLPQITKYALGEIKDTSISLSWTSNIPIDSNVRYTDTATGETKIQGKEEKTTDHALALEGLEAGKSYKIEIQGRDDKGNMAEIPAFEVRTGADNVPPEISQVRSQSAILGGAEDKVQAIISWRTNELADTKVLWDLGSTKGDKFSNETKLDSNLTTNHIAVITSFKPGTVYRFRVVSSDKFGNISISPDYTILTPVRRQSIIQMIVNQFEGIFGWMTRLR
jgi:phosphodiesterase/alkaline phosphatase D-like protein